MPVLKGKVWKYGDDINTDVIFPGKYTYTVTEPEEIAKHALEDLDPSFAREVQPGDIIVGGKNFGCGSSREQAASCLKYSGVSAVVAKSFSRLYFRNCINVGIPVIVAPEAVEKIQDKEVIEIDLEKGELRCQAGTFTFPPLAPEIMAIFRDGGLLEHTRKLLGTDKETEST
jgi:3-isopropylmalate/(R)-2-methylmalate dehydratase small subunit